MARVAPPRDQPDVPLSRSFLLLLGLGAIGSLGVIAVILYLIAMMYPRRLDGSGIVTRGGRRHAWSDFERIVPLRGDKYRLLFRTGRVIVVPTFLNESVELVDHLRRHGIDPTTLQRQ